MSTSVAINASLTASAAASNAASQSAARKAECFHLMTDYQDAGASTEQKREYSACVERLYPDPHTPASTEEKVAVGSVMAFVSIGMVLGALFSEGERVLGGIIGAVFGGALWFVGVLILAGINVLTS